MWRNNITGARGEVTESRDEAKLASRARHRASVVLGAFQGRVKMIATLFIAFVVVMAIAVVLATARYAGARAAAIAAAALCIWCVYAGTLSLHGVLARTDARPPGILFLFVPLILFLVGFVAYIARSSEGARLAAAFPLWLLIGAQVFRVGVEFFLHALWHDGLAPRMLTFSGANLDIYIGVSAPVVAWLVARRPSGTGVALVWNLLGLLSLANVVTRAVFTTPGPLNLIHSDIPNRLIGTFPYAFIPAFFVPLAVVLHVLALRAMRRVARA